MNHPSGITILQIIKGLDIGGFNGGSEKFGLELSQCLSGLGARVYLLAFEKHQTPVERKHQRVLSENGIEVLFGPRSYTNGMVRFLQDIGSFCREKQIEIVHSHFQVGSLVAAYLRKLKKVPIIIRTAHISKEWGTGLVPWIARATFTNLIYPMIFDLEVGVSDAVRNQLINHLGSLLLKREPIRIYNGLSGEFIEQARTCQTVRERRYFQEGDFVIGSIGRLTRRKGYPFLLATIRAIASEIPQVKLMLVGEGEDRHLLESEMQRLGLQAQVYFMGQRENIIEMFSEMDLFVLPSLEEGLPTVILESMVCQVPVVATDIPGTREIVQSGINGWLVPPANPEALGKAIIEAYQSPETRMLYSKNALEKIGLYSMRSIAEQYLAVYRKLSGR